MYQDWLNKKILVIGCGNPLLGDDGFGSAVIDTFEKEYTCANSIGVLDAGTAVREILFDLLLSDKRPDHLMIVDAGDFPGTSPGNILQINIDQIPLNKVHDYSLHQFPSRNMLKELKGFSSMDLQFFAVQVAHIPEFVSPGLSRSVKQAVAQMCELLMEKINEMKRYSVKRRLDHADL